MFFFWNQEFLPQRSTGAPNDSPCPRRCSGPAISRRLYPGELVPDRPNTGVAFPGNIIPASRIDSNGLALLNVFPQPNASNSTAYNYVTQTTTN